MGRLSIAPKTPVAYNKLVGSALMPKYGQSSQCAIFGKSYRYMNT